MANLQRLGDHPLVSAVIPTRGRPELLLSAVRSALRQTWQPLEVIVVIDGADGDTESRLAAITDCRLRTILLPHVFGGSAARNAGVRAACGDWIAFLDDDDEWLPGKIERQMHAVRECSAWFPVVTSRLIAKSPAGRRVLPQRLYDASQPVGDYLFCRAGVADPGGLMQTSTLLAPRELLLAVPFREELRMHQDWDWVIQVSAFEGVSIVMLSAPLIVWRVQDGRDSLSRTPDWQFSLSWIHQVRRLISRRAFSSFVAIQCVWRARQAHAGLPGRVRILWAFLFEGKPDWRSSLHFLAFGFIPSALRRALGNLLQARRDPALTHAGLCLAFTRTPTPAPLRKTSR